MEKHESTLRGSFFKILSQWPFFFLSSPLPEEEQEKVYTHIRTTKKAYFYVHRFSFCEM